MTNVWSTSFFSSRPFPQNKQRKIKKTGIPRIYEKFVECESHPDPIGADYEQAFAGANFNTEVVSGALVEVSGCHFKALATLKVSGDPLEAPLKSPDLCG